MALRNSYHKLKQLSRSIPCQKYEPRRHALCLSLDCSQENTYGRTALIREVLRMLSSVRAWYSKWQRTELVAEVVDEAAALLPTAQDLA